MTHMLCCFWSTIHWPLRVSINRKCIDNRVVKSEDFLGFRLQQFWKTDSDSSSFEKPTPTPAVLKNRLRLQQFWKTDSDSSSFEKPTPIPAVLKNRLRFQQFWKTDSDSSDLKKKRIRLQLKTWDSTDSDSTTLAVTDMVAASYL